MYRIEYVDNITGEVLTMGTADSLHLAKHMVEFVRSEYRQYKQRIPYMAIYEEDGSVYQHYNSDVIVDDLDLSVRSFNCLKRAGYNYSSEILALPVSDILKIRNLGKKCAIEVLTKVVEASSQY